MNKDRGYQARKRSHRGDFAVTKRRSKKTDSEKLSPILPRNREKGKTISGRSIESHLRRVFKAENAKSTLLAIGILENFRREAGLLFNAAKMRPPLGAERGRDLRGDETETRAAARASIWGFVELVNHSTAISEPHQGTAAEGACQA